MSAAQSIWKKICSRPRGKPFTVSEFLAYASRANVDQVLRRLLVTGKIARVSRGIYLRPKISRFVGPVAPAPDAVVAAQARQRNEQIQISGAEAARRLGLSLQMPVQPVFLTTGRSRTLRLGMTLVKLRHATARKFALAGRPAGEALVALHYLGRSAVTPEVLEKLGQVLPPAEFEALCRESKSMPGWMAEAIRIHRQSAPCA